MLAYALKRLLLACLVVLTVSGITFIMTNAAIDPAKAIAGANATTEDIEALRRSFGFDRPLVIQYLDWLGNALMGNFGESYRLRTSVAELLLDRLPVTMTLGGLALLFALTLSIPLGVVAALKPNSPVDRLALSMSVLGQALPTFWFALMMIILFGIILRWLPISGSGSWAHFVMPSIALGYYATPAFMRLTRAGMIEVLASDYIRTARAKGLRPATVLFKHALRNAVIPVVSLAAVQFGFMLGGSVVIETIFALHGVGFLAWESISRSDIPVVQAIVLLISLFYIVLTLLADLLNAYLDPRIRVG
ncbi:peptide/nickel transport system permease protein [Stella humosa]|uniref:Peptide/nickel transport system permease protein n=1 Tax=Stella humosa TaxID=94 RepID=A0A3N1KVP2_9PROT|nr:ABC transporter permease [Stella humosa]ROP84661.1 peptide/nickel transport system permease protein [Stella humosa]BBK34181.1 peptide ABC transporter permease [Stella humosa]